MTDRPQTAPVDKVKADILAGRYDGNLDGIVMAIHERALSGATQIRWSFEFEGETVREDDLTLGVTAMVERITKQDWSGFDPRLSAENCRVLLSVWLHKRDGIPLKDAEAKVEALNHYEFGKTFSVYEVPQVPLDPGPG